VVVGVWVKRAAIRFREYPSFIAPKLTGFFPFGALPLLVNLQEYDHGLGQAAVPRGTRRPRPPRRCPVRSQATLIGGEPADPHADCLSPTSRTDRAGRSGTAAQQITGGVAAARADFLVGLG
jgi:hypothetical protein